MGTLTQGWSFPPLGQIFFFLNARVPYYLRTLSILDIRVFVNSRALVLGSCFQWNFSALTIFSRRTMERPVRRLPRCHNSLTTALLVDTYQITMAYAYWRNGTHNRVASFDLFFRKNPFSGEFTVFAGLEECLRFVSNFHFTDADINYLRK